MALENSTNCRALAIKALRSAPAPSKGNQYNLSSSESSPQDPARRGFLELLAELRLNVYELVLTKKKPLEPWTKYCGYNLQPQLLRTCKQIEDECLPILHGNNGFHLEFRELYDYYAFSIWMRSLSVDAFACLQNIALASEHHVQVPCKKAEDCVIGDECHDQEVWQRGTECCNHHYFDVTYAINLTSRHICTIKKRFKHGGRRISSTQLPRPKSCHTSAMDLGFDDAAEIGLDIASTKPKDSHIAGVLVSLVERCTDDATARKVPKELKGLLGVKQYEECKVDRGKCENWKKLLSRLGMI